MTNTVDFLNGVGDLNFYVDPSTNITTSPATAALLAAFPSTSLTAILQTINNKVNANPTNTSFQTLMTDVSSVLAPTVTGSSLTTLINNIEDGFITTFRQINQAVPNSSGALGDWSPLASTGVDFKTLFENSFGQFITEYASSLNGLTGAQLLDVSTNNMMVDWSKFLAVRAVILTETATGQYANLPSFEKIYFAFFPHATQADFQSALSAFYTAQIGKPKGTFTPSSLVSDFLTSVEEDYAASLLPLPPPPGGSLDSINASNTFILVQVFELVASMITTLERIAVVQANRLSFYAKWENAYNSLIGQIPIFTAGDSSVFGLNNDKTNDSSGNARTDMNSQNNTMTQTLRSYRDMVGSQAQQHQTAIQQTQEAVTQQTNISTAIIQQMSTILQSIFSGA